MADEVHCISRDFFRTGSERRRNLIDFNWSCRGIHGHHFLFSLRYGFKDITKRDIYFLVIALVGLIPWALTNNPTLSVITAVSIDVVAFILTLRKT